MGSMWPLSNQMVFDNNGVRAPGAKVYFEEAGTSTPKAVYQDGDESTVHTDPVVADGNGRLPAVFVPWGSYKYRLTTSAGAAIGDTIDNIPNPAPVDEDFAVDELQLLTTGDVWFSFIDGERSGAVRCNGRTIGSSASAATERANPDTEDLYEFLWNALDNTAAPVSGGRGATAAADFGANKTLTLPDLRGALPIGLTDMGNSDSGGLASAPVTSGSAIIPGSVLGANTHTLSTNELSSHTHGVNGSTGTQSNDHTHAVNGTSGADGAHDHTINITDPGHSHSTSSTNQSGTKANEADTASAASQYMNAGTLGTGSNTTGITADAVEAGTHTHAVNITSGTVSADHTHTVNIVSAANGGGAAHNNVPKVLTGTWFMKL